MALIEKKKKQYRSIFEMWYENPRIEKGEICKVLGIDWKTLNNRIAEALDLGYIIGPHIKKKSYQNFKVNMYFAYSKDPIEAYLKYKEDNNIIYHARMDGFANLMVISKEKINIENTVFKGVPTDYHVSFPPNRPWDECINSIYGKINEFDIDGYVPIHIIKNHWNEKAKWHKTDEILYRELKYNFRKPLYPIIEKYDFYNRDVERWLEKLPKYCDILTYYYPESPSFYEPILYMFETDYEDFIVDIFSELPTSSLFFKVEDRLFTHMHIDRQFMRSIDSAINGISGLHVPLIIRDLKMKGIIRSSSRAIFAFHWRKDL